MKTNKKTIKERVEEILEKIRPYIEMHGGSMELIGVKNGVVTLQISGTCAHCSLADMTYNTLIAGILKQDVPGFRRLIVNK